MRERERSQSWDSRMDAVCSTRFALFTMIGATRHLPKVAVPCSATSRVYLVSTTVEEHSEV